MFLARVLGLFHSISSLTCATGNGETDEEICCGNVRKGKQLYITWNILLGGAEVAGY